MLKKIYILVLLLGIGFSTQGGNDKSISKIISKELKVPTALKTEKLNEKVNVQFRVAENGKATVLNVDTDNPELRKYIMNTFPKLDFRSAAGTKESVYFVDINFKVL